MDKISVTEAATLAGVGKSTVRRAIKKGDLLAVVEEGPNGEQFSVSVSSFEQWMISRGAPTVHLSQNASEGTSSDTSLVHQGEKAWDAVVESQHTVQKALDALERTQGDNIKMVRQVAHLEGKLESHKMLLSANNESISKQELRLDELRAAREEEIKTLEHHNKVQQERFENERKEFLEKLKVAEGQAQKFEKMPKWVRFMFGT